MYACDVRGFAVCHLSWPPRVRRFARSGAPGGFRRSRPTSDKVAPTNAQETLVSPTPQRAPTACSNYRARAHILFFVFVIIDIAAVFFGGATAAAFAVFKGRNGALGREFELFFFGGLVEQVVWH